MIIVIDYGAGNLKSVENALLALNQDFKVSDSAEAVENAERLIFPGVGHFGAMMANMERNGLRDACRAVSAKGIPILGICLGMQALFEGSEEEPSAEGLGLLLGKAELLAFQPGPRVPNMGWCAVSGQIEGTFYFANSFALPVGTNTLSTFQHGIPYSAIVAKDNLIGFQFHPEKSGPAGLALLLQFCQGELPCR